MLEGNFKIKQIYWERIKGGGPGGMQHMKSGKKKNVRVLL